MNAGPFVIAHPRADLRRLAPSTEAAVCRRRLPAVLLALVFAAAFTGCGTVPSAGSAGKTPPEPLTPSPRLIVGRVVAVDADQGFAFVELASDAPAAASTQGAELTTRTLDLTPTGQLEVSRYLRGRILGTRIIRGQPSPNDEVVWLAP